ncbi:MAG: DUF448 domain-containing protein [Synergistaceae bacterium]|jgi:predicted RNA-binding protein YlxR (DUF448 family)|nr:DUF448 domain-containing protein [Synergistaceae bacterium]
MIGTTPKQKPRTCVACREESPKRALVRVVRSPAGEVVLDERGKLPGRGAYICASCQCLEKAQKTKALARALKMEIPEALYSRLAEHLESYGRGAVDAWRELKLLLGLARRAGLIHIGVDSVKSQCVKETLLILTASDSSEAVKDAMDKAAGESHVRVRSPLSIEDFSASLGARNVQAAALPLRSGLSDKIRLLLSRPL